MFQTKILEELERQILLVRSIIFPENRAVYEIMWKNIVDRDRPQMTVWRMRIACWIPNATNTHTGCVTPIAFPLQQWLLHERALMYVTRTLHVLFLPWRQQPKSGPGRLIVEVSRSHAIRHTHTHTHTHTTGRTPHKE